MPSNGNTVSSIGAESMSSPIADLLSHQNLEESIIEKKQATDEEAEAIQPLAIKKEETKDAPLTGGGFTTVVNFIFNAIRQTLIKGVKIEAILPHLLQKKVIPEGDTDRYVVNPKNGMKILIGYLRNRSFNTFLDFTECIFLAQKDFPTKAQSTVVDSMIKAVQDFDQRNSTNHVQKIIDIQQKFLKQTGDFTMPAELEYVERPKTVSFQSQGGLFPEEESKYYGLSIRVPPGAVSEDEEVKLQVGVCCYGPFSITEQYQIASDFVVILADRKFNKPVEVSMEHCLILPDYKKCTEVLILKADHRKVTGDGLYTFDQFMYPEISPDHPELSFKIEEFCILCAVLGEGERVRSSSHSFTLSSQSHIDDSNPSSAQSSFDEEANPLGVEKSRSIGSQDSSTSSSDSGIGGLRKTDSEAPPLYTPMSSIKLLKRRHTRLISRHCSAEKRRCEIEYTALLFRSKEKVVDVHNQNYRFVIFICTNCSAAHKICKDHASDVLGVLDSTKVELTSYIAITINSKVLKLEAFTHKRGWSVEPDKTAEITKSEVQFHTLNRKDLFKRMELKSCPPRLAFTAEYDGSLGPIGAFSCEVVIKGATTMETGKEVLFNVTASKPKEPIESLYRQSAAFLGLYRQPAIDYNSMEYLYPQRSYQQRPPQPLYPPYPYSRPPVPLHVPPLSSRFYGSPSTRSHSASDWPSQRSQAVYSEPEESDDSGGNHGSLVSLLKVRDLNLYSDTQPSQGEMYLAQVCKAPSEYQRSSSRTLASGPLQSIIKERDRSSSFSQPDLNYYENLLTLEEKQQIVDNKFILAIVEHIKSWERTARLGYGFTEAEISQLRFDYQVGGFKECAYQAHLKWIQHEGFCDQMPLTAWTMLQTLRKAGEFEAVHYLVHKFKT